MKEHIIIVGAGLSGTLLAIRLAERGYEVSLHEKRGDLRKEALTAGRSINLALSNRGLEALAQAGVTTAVLEACIPMRGRMIHPKGGAARLSPYSGRTDDYINSVSRPGLNGILLDKAEALSNVTLYFESTCLSVDVKAAKATFRDNKTGKTSERTAALVIGTDGAGSAVRKSLMANTTALLFNYSQHFLRHGYKELSILPAENNGFKLEKHALHIWPRGEHMIIALPNLDGSFTVTMFHPFAGEFGFDAMQTKEDVQRVFESEYADLLPYIPHYLEEYFENPTGTLGTIKCYPWQAYGKTLIMGDAAHAIVPFYGQGMNASFEDVRVFDDLMEGFSGDWTALLEEFQDVRSKNTDAIADLALDNFYEMRDHVAMPAFVKKRQLEVLLEQQFKDYYSKYSLVTFRPDLPYAEAMALGRKQDAFLLELCAQSDDTAFDLNAVMEEVRQLNTTKAEA